ncbi:VOC family protein [Nocardia aurea]|uniref:VOC family protein n=1 Tax=Nocardia aurea TaxID=2144174 RepID=A0ABV3FNQ4_9NOCA
MKVVESIACLNVDDVPGAVAFFAKYFGFEELFAADGFASLSRPDSGMKIALHRRGLEVLPEGFRDQRMAGVMLAFQVEDLEVEERRLQAEGAPFLLPMTRQEWGERALLVAGPEGIVVELCDFPEAPGA